MTSKLENSGLSISISSSDIMSVVSSLSEASSILSGIVLRATNRDGIETVASEERDIAAQYLFASLLVARTSSVLLNAVELKKTARLPTE